MHLKFCHAHHLPISTKLWPQTPPYSEPCLLNPRSCDVDVVSQLCDALIFNTKSIHFSPPQPVCFVAILHNGCLVLLTADKGGKLKDHKVPLPHFSLPSSPMAQLRWPRLSKIWVDVNWLVWLFTATLSLHKIYWARLQPMVRTIVDVNRQIYLIELICMQWWSLSIASHYSLR